MKFLFMKDLFMNFLFMKSAAKVRIFIHNSWNYMMPK